MNVVSNTVNITGVWLVILTPVIFVVSNDSVVMITG